MQDNSRYVVGIDIGTTTVRCVVGHMDISTGAPTIVGTGQAPNTGMRKGVVSVLGGPAQAIDTALGEAERMSGYQVNEASLSINGSHILSTKADGMIAVGAMDHEVTEQDVARLEEVATTGKVPANREILEVVPHSYRLDGQDGIKDPVGMTGTRLEINANVVSVLSPYIANLQKTAEMAKVGPHAITPSVLAAARAVLSESQMENGVAVIDLGGATTSVAVYEEGDLQYVAVVPVGGNSVTNDLAIGLKTDPEIAELVKLEHGRINRGGEATKAVQVKHDKQTYTFEQQDIDEIIEARLEELFEAVNKELKKAGRAGRLPSGVVLVGGGAKIKGLVDYAKAQLELAVRIGQPHGYAGVSETASTPEYSAAVGLMLIDGMDGVGRAPGVSAKSGGGALGAVKKTGGIVNKLLGKFK